MFRLWSLSHCLEESGRFCDGGVSKDDAMWKARDALAEDLPARTTSTSSSNFILHHSFINLSFVLIFLIVATCHRRCEYATREAIAGQVSQALLMPSTTTHSSRLSSHHDADNDHIGKPCLDKYEQWINLRPCHWTQHKTKPRIIPNSTSFRHAYRFVSFRTRQRTSS